MKKFRASEFWYEITQAPNGATGAMERVYVVTCKCGRLSSQRPGSISEERMRKNLVRQGWSIGRTTTAHLCPSCATKPKPKPVSRPAPEPVPDTVPVYLEAAWMGCNEATRRAFVLRIRDDFPDLMTAPPTLSPAIISAPEPTDLAPEIPPPGLPYEPEPVAAPQPEPVPEPEPESISVSPEIESDDADEEPAAWWLELQKARVRHVNGH